MPSLDISNSEMSSPSRNLLSKVRRIVPPMLESFHKGQLGRVTVVGGSIDYTGAPYFSAMASAKLGCDMSHIICEPSAATVIKSYSPNLMVHPYLQSSKTTSGQSSSALAEPIITFLQRIHVLVVGPGLGRDETTQNIVVEVMKVARERNIPFVLDADGLLLVQKNPELVKGYPECILTPNVVEFGRLAKAMGIDISNSKGAAVSKTEACEKLSMALGGVTIIQKGQSDIISNGIMSLVSDVRGGLKRSGGQGDTLTGSLGTFLAWRKAYHDGLWDQTPRRVPEAKSREHIKSELEKTMEEKMSPRTTLLLAAWAGSAITRECSRRAFAAKGRSMQASDLTDEVHQSFLSLIGEPDEPKL